MSRHLYKLKGGSLIYTLMLSLIIASLLGAYIMVNFYQSQLLNKQYNEQLAYHNLESGLNIFLHRHQIGDRFSGSLFESDIDSFAFESEPWGLLGLIHIKGKHKKAISSRSILLGQVPQKSFTNSLYLADQGQPLVLSGDTYLGGDLTLPSVGLKTGYVNRQGFLRKKLHEGILKKSYTTLPLLNNPQIQAIQDSLKQLDYYAALSESYALRNLHHFQKWDSIPFAIKSSSSLLLDDMSLEGKCLIASANTISISPTAQLENVLLFAKKIIIQRGFKGQLQAFATDSLIVESEVELKYPSILFLQSQDKQQASYLSIADNNKLAGAIIFDKNGQENRGDYCHLGKSLIYGHVYASHALDLQADVRGSVICGEFLLQTPATRYRNYLVDARLDYRKLSRDYVMPLLVGSGELGIIHWLREGVAW